jgi:hypothetical protein
VSGFKATPANLLTVPVYAFACLITCLVGFAADHYGQQRLFQSVRLIPLGVTSFEHADDCFLDSVFCA